MSRFLIFFAIIVIWLIINFIKSRHFSSSTRNEGSPGSGKRPGHLRPAGKKYSWTWMQAAGAFNLKFIRPELSNGYPAINGSINDLAVTVQVLPGTGSSPECMEFRFRFPVSAQLGLTLTAAQDREEVPQYSSDDQTALLIELLKTRPFSACSMQTANPEILRRCADTEFLDHISRLSLIYQKVTLTDAELVIRTAGICNDLEIFRRQLEILIRIASAFADFARKAAERRNMTITVTRSDMMDDPLEPAVKKTPDPNPHDAPESPPAEEKSESSHEEERSEPKSEVIAEGKDSAEPDTENSDLPRNRHAFLNYLWQSGASAGGHQKELFAPFIGREVEWEGVLKSCYSYSSDFVFGKAGGLKAALELEELKPQGCFLPIRIKAVVSFPKSEQERLNRASGKTFRFHGKLLKIEPIAREIYLSDGSITGAIS